MKIADARLYGIVDLAYVAPGDAESMLGELIAGGIDVVQFRAKEHPPESLIPLACRLAALARAAGVPFVVNDHPELAVACNADAVHVGQDDLSIAEARERTGGSMWVGRSTHSLAQAEAAQGEGADYIGFGPLFATPTKPDYSPIGMADIREAHARVRVPIFCIGGIKPENLPDVLAAGAHRVVIVSGLLLAESPRETTRRCRGILDAFVPSLSASRLG